MKIASSFFSWLVGLGIILATFIILNNGYDAIVLVFVLLAVLIPLQII